jgi:hypothetical protein
MQDWLRSPDELRSRAQRAATVRHCGVQRTRGMVVKHLLFITLLAGAVAACSSAQAQNYPWCAVLNMGDAAYNCGFLTEQQCRETLRGIGGFCVRNTTYQPPGPSGRRPGTAR